jgi:polyisoprenoid-binding protein YceI
MRRGVLLALFVVFGLAWAQSYQVQGGEARYRVREQLAGVNFPSDAVGVTSGVSGQVSLEGNRVSGRIVIRLDRLKSDQARRDGFLARNTLQTDRYPEAIFVPQEIRGLPNPLPQTGRYSMQITGQLTIRGVTRSVVWQAEVAFEGTQARISTRTSFPFERFDLTQPRVFSVLSVENEIRLEADLVFRRV